MHGTFFCDFPGFPGFPVLVGTLLSRDKRCFFTRSGRRVLIRLPSVTYCTSQLTSQRACKYCCVVVYTDTQKKVRFISFLPSDMMHVHFASRKVAKKQGPKCQFQKDVKSRCII